MGALTRLNTINQMLLYSGESIVSDLDGASGVDTSIAEFILDQKTIDYQERGLANNQRTERVTPAQDGRIKLRTDCISVTMVNPPAAQDDGPLQGLPSRIVTRGGYLYNMTDDTDYFDPTKQFDLNYVLEVEWEDMDTPIQKAIMMQASREYQMLSQGDPSADSYLAALEGRYTAKAKGADVKAKGYSILTQGDNAIKRILGGRNMAFDPDRYRFYGPENYE